MARPVGLMGARSGPQVLRRVRQERDVSGALERDGEFPLMTGARAGLAARLDLGSLREVAAEAVDLLVVDQDGLVGAERADLAAAAVPKVVVALLGAGGRRHRVSISPFSSSEWQVVQVRLVELVAPSAAG